MDQIEEESRQLERQWALRRERAHYEAERAWEDKLRAVEEIDREHARWRSEEPLVLHEADIASLRALGENLPHIWRAPTTSPADRKRILRFIIREVILDQKRVHGQVWLRILWQTGATSEHCLSRHVQSYRDHVDLEGLRRRITQLNADGKMDKEIAEVLNQEGFVAARGCAFRGGNVWLLRKRWDIATVKINGANPKPAVARRQLLDPRRGDRARRDDTNGLRLPCTRPAGGASAHEGPAMAN